jgi:hypothetical protein
MAEVGIPSVDKVKSASQSDLEQKIQQQHEFSRVGKRKEQHEFSRVGKKKERSVSKESRQ